MSEHNIVVEGGTSVRLLTAGKYCDRDILVTAEGGGLALDVVTASALPDTVVDGQIVVITETAAGTVYIDTDEPASPASGDVWVKLESGSDVALELTEESPYLGGGLTEANQWVGSTWLAREGYIGINGKWTQFAWALPPVGTALNDLTWEEIATISAAGLAKRYFAVGDAKQITINGTVGQTTFSNVTAWAFIIGIYHDPEHEGGNYITFQIGKSAQTGGVDIAYVDSKYGNQTTGSGYFIMRSEAYNSVNTGGWNSTIMRQTILGNNENPQFPLSGSFMAALPADLLLVMKGITKYTDNAGGASLAAASVTKTTDYLWLPAEFEITGTRTYANSAEQNYQKQYDYYASGNGKNFYKYNSTSTNAWYWTRSPANKNSNEYWCVYSGNNHYATVRMSYGIAPCFCV